MYVVLHDAKYGSKLNVAAFSFDYSMAPSGILKFWFSR